MSGSCVLTAFSQQETDAITKVFSAYGEAFKKGNSLKMMDYIYPKVFEGTSKEDVAREVDAIFQDTEKAFTVNEMNIQNISAVVEKENIKYVRILYRLNYSMNLGENKDVAKQTYEMMLSIHGEDAVQYDTTSSLITISQNTRLFAIHNPEYGDWKLMEQPTDFNIIPEDVMNKILQ